MQHKIRNNREKKENTQDPSPKKCEKKKYDTRQQNIVKFQQKKK